MSQDESGFKKAYGSIYPEGAIDAGGGPDRVEPLLTAEQLKSRFFFGINLISPITKEKIDSTMLMDFIKRGISKFELDSKVLISPVLRRMRLPFDPALYAANIWLEVGVKPISKLKKVSICSASYANTAGQNDRYPSGAEIYTLPNDWMDMSYASKGILFCNPINPAFSAIGTQTAIAASGASILQFIGIQGWVPAYWTIECVTGFCSEEGNVPVFINEIIGCVAAMLICDNLIPLFRIASQSLSMDGLGQSINDLSYQLITQKRQQLEKDYTALLRQIKTMTNNNIIVSNI